LGDEISILLVTKTKSLIWKCWGSESYVDFVKYTGALVDVVIPNSLYNCFMIEQDYFEKILVLCVGNICRSPIAEVILQQKLPSIIVESAGMAALVGREKHVYADSLLKENSYDIDEHNARQLTSEMLVSADLIFVMERKHQEILMKFYPHMIGKIFLLGKWKGDLEIPDPYEKSYEYFSHVFNQIEECTTAWVEKAFQSPAT
jgi:protein-tyrosine phosphatase